MKKSDNKEAVVKIDKAVDKPTEGIPTAEQSAPEHNWLWNLPTAPEKSQEGYPHNTLGLAISGGGVRSATFALGFLQSLARRNLLRRIDLMSTVSGGGYVGSFLGRYFDQLRSLPNIDAAGQHPAHEIVASTLTNNRSTTITWLREHANYLASTGSSESLFNIATFWRNFLALHFVLGAFFFTIFGIMNGVFYWEGLTEALKSSRSLVESVSPVGRAIAGPELTMWWLLTEATLWYFLLPVALGYWMVSEDQQSRVILPVLAIYGLITFAATIVLKSALPLGIFAAMMLAVVWGMSQVRQQIGSANPNSGFRRLWVRHLLTQVLATATVTLFVLGVLGLINAIVYFLTQTLLVEQLSWTDFLGRISLLVGPFLLGAPLLRGLAGLVSNQKSGSGSLLGQLAKVPYLLTGIIFLVGTILPLSVVAFFSHAVYGNGGNFGQGIAATICGIIITLLLGARSTRAFVNRSGPLPLYASRLSRVFLGAVNPARHRQYGQSDVTSLIPGDDVDLDKYKPHLAGGPLHLFNIAVNETVDVASQRGQRDRQGENMAIGPVGLNIAQRWHAEWGTVQDSCIQVKPITDGVSPHPFWHRFGKQVLVERLSVRMWMAISGAAVSSGAGRLTGAAFSLLVTLGNFRLGYWWDSGLSTDERALTPIRPTMFERTKRWLMELLTTQSLLISELRGRFGGPWRRYIYLSDGGHFENSGAYELLRRRVPLLIVVDGGQDRKGQSVGLGELTRLARIDFECELDPVEMATLPALGVPPGIANTLGMPADLLPNDKGIAQRHATLMKATYPAWQGPGPDPWYGRNHSWMLYIRLSITGDEPMDIVSYQAQNSDFPNQTTLDQDFDEPQFESYRKLGEHIGEKLFP